MREEGLSEQEKAFDFVKNHGPARTVQNELFGLFELFELFGKSCGIDTTMPTDKSATFEDLLRNSHSSGSNSPNSSNGSTSPFRTGTFGPSQSVQSSQPHVLLKSAEAARYLDISISEFKRREKAGDYVASKTSGRHRLYDRAHLELRTQERGKKKVVLKLPVAALEKAMGGEEDEPREFRGSQYESQIVCKVFHELSKDDNLIRIVQETGILPSIVFEIFSDWRQLQKYSGGFHISGEAARRISKLEIDGFPVADGEELANALCAIAETTKLCAGCGKKPRRAPRFCQACEQDKLSR